MRGRNKPEGPHGDDELIYVDSKSLRLPFIQLASGITRCSEAEVGRHYLFDPLVFPCLS